MTENNHPAHKHPSQYSDEELLAILRAIHRSLTAEMLTLKHEVRERVARI